MQTQVQAATERHPQRGFVLVFLVTFLNLLATLLTGTALGALGEWTRWQFVGLFGLVEAASGIACVFAPNIWRLPVLAKDGRRNNKLDVGDLLEPHWVALGRMLAGLVLLAYSGTREGFALSSALLLPTLPLLALSILGLSALAARTGVAVPTYDVVQLDVDWGGERRRLPAFSVGASVIQFVMSIISLPVASLASPGLLFGPELAPSPTLLLALLMSTLAMCLLIWLLWRQRIA